MLSSPARVSLDRFINSQASTEKTLDLGCGPSPYAKWFPDRVGADFVARPGVHVRSDAHLLPFATEQFGIVLCTEVLEHVCEPSQVIAEIGRVLKPGGTCILTTRFCYPIHDAPRDFYRFTSFSLRYLFRQWDLVELAADTSAPETLSLMGRYAVHELRGPFSRPVKLAWSAFERLQNIYLTRRAKAPHRVDESRLPSGYYVIARKPTSAFLG
jgi:SAM-dependent methyltransferase